MLRNSTVVPVTTPVGLYNAVPDAEMLAVTDLGTAFLYTQDWAKPISPISASPTYVVAAPKADVAKPQGFPSPLGTPPGKDGIVTGGPAMDGTAMDGMTIEGAATGGFAVGRFGLLEPPESARYSDTPSTASRAAPAASQRRVLLRAAPGGGG
jgi:hypothetical protein